jgi:Secretory pathway protein Sec39
MITSADIIAQYSFELSLRELVTIREGAEEVQKQLIDRLLQSGNWKTRNEEQWRKLRQSLKWLQLDSLVLGKVSGDALDSSILSALLDSSGMCHITTSNVEAFGLAREIYVRQSLLPSNIVEKTILDAFYRFYDNATNGNRTRGGMKNAFQTYSLLNTNLVSMSSMTQVPSRQHLQPSNLSAQPMLLVIIHYQLPPVSPVLQHRYVLSDRRRTLVTEITCC